MNSFQCVLLRKLRKLRQKIQSTIYAHLNDVVEQEVKIIRRDPLRGFNTSEYFTLANHSLLYRNSCGIAIIGIHL